MVSRVIYKYPMTDVSIRVPYGVVRHIAAQQPGDQLPTVWVEHGMADLESKGEDNSMIEINLVGTGHPFEDGWQQTESWSQRESLGKFFQTAICLNGQLVFHCFERAVN